MAMPALLEFHTADMVRALNEAEPQHWPRYETVHGELLVSPAPLLRESVDVLLEATPKGTIRHLRPRRHDRRCRYTNRAAPPRAPAQGCS